ncbi:MAG: hypothetical protein NWE89_00680 [Candidatus Bathyarchaeota archaeon]|nr:hypothetical protein [Candidatus Bathyarchaeota archaeon]
MSEEDTAQATLNMRIWEKVERPPADVLDEIEGGHMKGKTSINPMWRLQALTEQFGPCGIGWKIVTDRKWTEPGPEGQVFAFVDLSLYIREKGKDWGEPIPGTGGSLLIAKQFVRGTSETTLYMNDDAFKMAATDALSVACKELGFGAAIHFKQWDGSKYKEQPVPIDESKLADWWSALEEAAEGELVDFKEWWTENGDTVKEDLGQAGASRIYNQFRILNKKKKEAE